MPRTFPSEVAFWKRRLFLACEGLRFRVWGLGFRGWELRFSRIRV